MKKKKKLLIISGFVLAVTAAGAFGYRAIAGRAAASSDLRTGTVSTGTVSTTISGSGSVRSRQNATASWQTSGTVGSVPVQMGQKVQIGEELASLDPSTISTGIIQAQSDLIDAQNAYEELLKPDPLKIAQAQIAFDDAAKALEDLRSPTDAAMAEAELAVVNAQSAADDAQSVVDRLKYGRASDETIASSKAGYLLAQQKVEQMQHKYDDVGGNPETDAIKALALTNLESAKTEMRRALANLNWYLGTPTEEEVAEKKAALAVALASLQTAKDKLEKLNNPTVEDIALAEATLADAQEALDTAKVGATEDELTVANTRVMIAEAELAKMHLTAPFSGTITSISTLAGDIVTQGDSAFRIDDMSSLYVDMSISEVDILQVKYGQEASITFDAIGDKTYTGKVVQIGMAATSSQGVVNYPVTVQITDPEGSIFPGMTASIDIVVEEHADVMVVPSSAIRTTAGQRTVTVLYQGQQISVAVTVGLSSNSMTEVSSASLKEGDVVVLNTSSSSSSSSSNNRQFSEGGVMIMQDSGVEVFQGPPGMVP